MARAKKQKKKLAAIMPRRAMRRNNTVSGVPRQRDVKARPKVDTLHRDVTKESITAYLQPFYAYEQRLLGGLPIGGQAQPAYGFWTRNVINVTDVPYASGGNAGVWLTVNPWSRNQIAYATGLDVLGVPTAFTGLDDPFHVAISANFESIVCAYQGVRVKNLTAVLQQAGESFIGRYPQADMVQGYAAHRVAGTNFVKSSADPGVMLTLNYEGTAGMTPQTVGNICDYAWNVPAAFNIDPQATKTLFRSQGSASSLQTWEIEVVTYYLSRPFANTSVFFAPVKHEVDMKTFDRAVDRALALAPEMSIQRNAIKDDGDSPSLLDDLGSIWNGAKAVGRVANAAWSGLSSLFGLSVTRRHLMILSLIRDDRELAEFTRLLQTGSLGEQQAKAVTSLTPPSLTPEQVRAIRALIEEAELKGDDASYELLTATVPSSFRVNPRATQRV